MNEVLSSGTEFMLYIATAILVFLSLLFSLFLLTTASKNKLGNQILAAYLIIRAVDASVFIYMHSIDLPPILEVLRHDIGTFFQSPLLYLFILSIVYADFSLKWKHLLHLVPFVIGTLIMMPRFYLPVLSGEASSFTKDIEVNAIYWLAALQQVGYLTATFFLLTRYRRILRENYSMDGNSNYTWLLRMNFFLVFIFVISSFKNIYKLLFWGEYGYVGELRLFVIVAMLLFTCWLVLKALYAPKIFAGIDSSLQLSTNVKEDAVGKALAKKIDQLKAYLEKEEPYLNPDLTIKELAAALEMDVSDLSYLINRRMNLNFYEFISQYRIEKAMQMLKDPTKNSLSILEVLYHVGYNSKSSFNTSFKAKTGMTPTEYKRSFSSEKVA